MQSENKPRDQKQEEKNDNNSEETMTNRFVLTTLKYVEDYFMERERVRVLLVIPEFEFIRKQIRVSVLYRVNENHTKHF